MNTGSKVVPDLDGPNAPHWQGAREGRLVVQRCDDCGKARYPHAGLCPACSSAASSWREISPSGRVHGWCRFHRAYFPEFRDELPYTVLWVRMDDGVDLFSNFESAAFGQVPTIGQAVTAVFEEVAPQVSLVRFRAQAETGAPLTRCARGSDA